jgi:hypothetical protein
MGLGLALPVRLGHAMALESQPVAAVGIGADQGDGGNARLDQTVEADRAGYARVADEMRNNATLPSAISSPYDGPALFF